MKRLVYVGLVLWLAPFGCATPEQQLDFWYNQRGVAQTWIDHIEKSKNLPSRDGRREKEEELQKVQAAHREAIGRINADRDKLNGIVRALELDVERLEEEKKRHLDRSTKFGDDLRQARETNDQIQKNNDALRAQLSDLLSDLGRTKQENELLNDSWFKTLQPEQQLRWRVHRDLLAAGAKVEIKGNVEQSFGGVAK